MCKCVSVFFGGWWMNSFASSISLLYFLGYGLSLFLLLSCFLFFFDMPCEHVAYLLWVWIFYFSFLCVSHILDGNLGEREKESHGVTWSLILWWVEVLAIFQCESIEYEWMCMWSWSWEYEMNLTKGHNNLTKLNEKTSCICGKAFQTCDSSGFGKEFGKSKRSLQGFLCFF